MTLDHNGSSTVIHSEQAVLKVNSWSEPLLHPCLQSILETPISAGWCRGKEELVMQLQTAFVLHIVDTLFFAIKVRYAKTTEYWTLAWVDPTVVVKLEL